MSEQPITRRKLLAVAGSVAIAGCGNNSDRSDWGTKYATETRQTSRPTTGTVPSRTPTETDTVEINVDEPTETRVETQPPTDEEPEQTPTDRDTETTQETTSEVNTVAAKLERARTLLSEAVTTFTGGAETDITGVSPADSFQADAVRNTLESASDNLQGLEPQASHSQLETAEQLGAGVDLVTLLTDCQQSVHQAYQTLTELDDALYEEAFRRADELQTQQQGQVSAARASLSNLEERTDSPGLDAVEAIDASTYDQKLAGFETAIEELEFVGEKFEQFRTVIQALSDGVEEYTNATYGDAQVEFFRAFDTSETIYTSLITYDPPEFLERLANDISEANDVIADATENLERSAQYGSDNETQDRRRTLSRGLRDLQSHSITRGLPSTRELAQETDI